MNDIAYYETRRVSLTTASCLFSTKKWILLTWRSIVVVTETKIRVKSRD